MASRFGFASPDLEIDSVDSGENTLIVPARGGAATASCPLCGGVSHRVQSLWCGGFGAAYRAVRARYSPKGSTRRCWPNESGALDVVKRSFTI